MINFTRKPRYGYEDLLEIIRLLRSPEGCPWDRVQTHQSIRRGMLEEAYEAAEAIDTDNAALLKEELGDVLMQALFHTDIEREAGHFDIDDVADAACKKLVYRHPHVFRRDEPDAPDWDTIKQRERAQTTTAEAMDSVARSLPALWRCEKIQAKAARTGFEWPDADAALDKVAEETQELREAVASGDADAVTEELGDLLLQVVFHSRIETEQGHFTLDDVCTDICNKLIIRHPHVFSTVQADTTEEVLKNWDTIKEETKHQTTRTQTLEAVAKTLPALMRAQKVCKRALKGNNRFLCNESVLASVTECKHTLEEAMHMEDAEQITRAMGELLFCCAGMAQTLGLSAEQVLTDTTNQFIDCFRAMEETCTAEKREMETLSHGEWNALWKKTKQNLEEEATHAAG